jgi:hypothetical protein
MPFSSTANFVGFGIDFLNVLLIRLVVSPLPPRYPLNKMALKRECDIVITRLDRVIQFSF